MGNQGMKNVNERYEKNTIDEYSKTGSSFLEYTKKRKELGIDSINTIANKNSIEYLQKKHVEYLKGQTESSSTEKRRVGYDPTNIFKQSKLKTDSTILEEENNSNDEVILREEETKIENEVERLSRKERREKRKNEFSAKTYFKKQNKIDTTKKPETLKRNVVRKEEENKEETKSTYINEANLGIDQNKEVGELERNRLLENLYRATRPNNWNDYGKPVETIKDGNGRKIVKQDVPKGIKICGGYIATEEYRENQKKTAENNITKYVDSIHERNNDILKKTINEGKTENKEYSIYNGYNVGIMKQEEAIEKLRNEYKKYIENKKEIEKKETEEKIHKMIMDQKNKMEEREVYLTQEGFEELEQELRKLKTEERDIIAERIKIAKSYGDLSENAEYDEAKSAQEANENKIAELEEMIKHAKIIDENTIDTTTVQIGNTVYITNIANKKEQKYTIVGVREANVLEGKISNESPIAKSLLGAKVGDVVQVEAPVGIVEYKVKRITF